ncbi:MAG: hypothetical protein ACRDS1_03320 [Pseudonocardiaceae bacterium]
MIALLERAISYPKWGPTLKISLLITIPLAAIVTVAFVAAPALPWAIGGSGVALGSGALARKFTKNRKQIGEGHPPGR